MTSQPPDSRKELSTKKLPGCGPTPSGLPALFAQSMAVISPTMTAVLIIPLAFASAGQGTWLAYAFGTVMLLFVVFCLNQFARRSASAGSMYAYTARGLGPTMGVFSGWTLIWSYLFIAVAGLCGFAVFCQQLISALGFHVTVHPIIFFAISAFVVLARGLQGHPGVVAADPGPRGPLGHLHPGPGLRGAVQARLHRRHHPAQAHGVGVRGMGLAIVACIFSLVGFESATALGGEAKHPKRNIPKAVIASLICTGLFMVFMAYVEVAGTRGYHTPFTQIGRPAQRPGRPLRGAAPSRSPSPSGR